MLLHASCVAIDGKGVLLLGDSGAGKSDLALCMIDQGAVLVSDDQTELKEKKHTIYASPPVALKGLLEARGVGVLTVPYLRDIPLVLAVKLVPREDVVRLPDPQFFDCLGTKVPLLSLHAFDHSAGAKIRLFLRHHT